ncbi:MAG: HD domain-containing protein [Candidatus Moraniibacteriota bacterium]
MYKAQVFSLPRNPHIRKRLTHGLEVTSLAGTIAEILGLNIALVEAGSIAHDIGHTPYGHLGESFLTTVLGREFRHNIFGTIVAQHIERKGVGLNLAFETLEGILFHSGGRKSISSWSDLRAEYAVIRLADKIAFTFSDLNDALRYGYLGSDRGFDAMVWNWFGSNQRERIANCVHALVQESAEENHISFSRSETAQRFEELKKWMYENVYSQVDSTIQATILERTYDFLSTGPAFEECDPAMLLALLTDDETDAIGHILLESKRLRADNGLIKNFGIMEIIPDLKGKRIDLFDPDLGWGTKP